MNCSAIRNPVGRPTKDESQKRETYQQSIPLPVFKFLTNYAEAQGLRISKLCEGAVIQLAESLGYKNEVKKGA